MKLENIIKFFSILATILWVLWIVFNPYITVQNSDFIVSFSENLNWFCGNFNLSYRFAVSDLLALLRFLEYSIFGTLAGICCKIYFKNLWRNIITPLFFGLSVAMIEIWVRSGFAEYVRISDMAYSFLNFCIGLLVFWQVSKFILQKKPSFKKYKSNKYIGRS